MEIGLSGLPQKTQSMVDRWNADWRSLQSELEQVATMRETILDDLETGAPGDLVAKAGALEGRVFSVHQRKVAALRSRDEILVSCETAQQTVLEDCEAGLRKAEKAAETALRKAGFAPEDDPKFDANVEAARNRLRVKVMEAGPVRQARNSRNDGEQLLNRISEMRREDRMILQNAIDELATVGKRLLRL